MYCADIKDSSCSQTKLLARELIDHLRSKAGEVDCKFSTNMEKRLEKCVHYDDVVLMFEKKVGPRQLVPLAPDPQNFICS